MNWQKIDTAPKDGTPILGFDSEVLIISWFEPKKEWQIEGGGLYDDYHSSPTHWMPLPEPPK